MNKKTPTINANIIPILIIVALIIGAGYYLTKGDIKIPFLNKDDNVDAEHVEGFPREVYTTQELDKKRLVLKSQEELDNFLNEIDSTGLTTVEENINFNRYWVIAVSSESEQTDGYKLKIKKVYVDEEDNSMLVSALLTEPGKTCLTNEVNNISVDMVKIRHTDKTIEFERLKETKECGDISEEELDAQEQDEKTNETQEGLEETSDNQETTN